jgi:MscS family membrane protein
MEQLLPHWAGEPYAIAGAYLVGSLLAAFALELLLRLTLGALAHRTKTDLDDKMVAALRIPIFLSVLLWGTYGAAMELGLPPDAQFFTRATLSTFAVLLWARALSGVGGGLLQAVTAKAHATALVQKRTLPIFDMTLKVAVFAGAIYFTFVAWGVDLTAWLASAGILGIAVGFAAKDSLANLFSGIFIVVDGPYQVGDYIVLDGELRGEVSHIGMRSTRVLTRDDVEITVPNAVIAAGKIVNESGGPHVKQRVAICVEAAYGSDVDQVAEVLLSCPEGVANICASPAAQIRFRSFGASGLVFELLVWSDRPARRGLVVSDLNFRVYKAFAAAGLEIPFSKHDLYIKELPAGRRLAG